MVRWRRVVRTMSRLRVLFMICRRCWKRSPSLWITTEDTLRRHAKLHVRVLPLSSSLKCHLWGMILIMWLPSVRIFNFIANDCMNSMKTSSSTRNMYMVQGNTSTVRARRILIYICRKRFATSQIYTTPSPTQCETALWESLTDWREVISYLSWALSRLRNFFFWGGI